jgi:hypothetical protein
MATCGVGRLVHVGSTRSVNAGSKWGCAGAGLAGPVSWLACLGDGPISPSTRVMNTMSLSLSIYIYIWQVYAIRSSFYGSVPFVSIVSIFLVVSYNSHSSSFSTNLTCITE